MALLALGCFLFAFSMAKEWKRDLRKLEKMVKTKPSKADVSKQVIEFVRAHSFVKELSSLIELNRLIKILKKNYFNKNSIISLLRMSNDFAKLYEV